MNADEFVRLIMMQSASPTETPTPGQGPVIQHTTPSPVGTPTPVGNPVPGNGWEDGFPPFPPPVPPGYQGPQGTPTPFTLPPQFQVQGPGNLDMLKGLFGGGETQQNPGEDFVNFLMMLMSNMSQPPMQGPPAPPEKDPGYYSPYNPRDKIPNRPQIF